MSAREAGEAMRASVIVPVHGHAALTERCLDALLPTLPSGCEAIVVDDASPDATAALLAGYGEHIHVVSLDENVGFAGACNAGAAAARGEALVFLNNDTEPRAGWLAAMLTYAEEHPAADIVGAKLVFPNRVVQHAGVVFGQDGYPHNLYAGFPEDRPEVNRRRRLQAVTGACMLVRRDAFEALGGFDPGFLNSLEDVDLCLRAGARGGEVHYCHEAVVVHLESASRGRSDRFERSVALYRERWRDTVRRDDLEVYLEDGLLDVEYAPTYPLRLTVSPLLGALDDGRRDEVEPLLETYARQVSDLLAEVMRLTAIAGTGEAPRPAAPTGTAVDHRGLLAEANRLEEEARDLQRRFVAAREEGGADSALTATGGPPLTATDSLGYRRQVERVRAAIEEVVPGDAEVLVVSRGDRELVALGARAAGHFPQDPAGGYLGHHPAGSEDAIAQLERLRAAGASHLVLPATDYWWLDHYRDFAAHLRDRYPAADRDACTIFHLTKGAA
ncbi:MAG: glycosyltransferase family 2 protein [Actinobacteria bacterium]|nr:glycosyltransferase family 2 protein [Actinomycetota bacterium]